MEAVLAGGGPRRHGHGWHHATAVWWRGWQPGRSENGDERRPEDYVGAVRGRPWHLDRTTMGMPGHGRWRRQAMDQKM
jgi:hypothetical protein